MKLPIAVRQEDTLNTRQEAVDCASEVADDWAISGFCRRWKSWGKNRNTRNTNLASLGGLFSFSYVRTQK